MPSTLSNGVSGLGLLPPRHKAKVRTEMDRASRASVGNIPPPPLEGDQHTITVHGRKVRGHFESFHETERPASGLGSLSCNLLNLASYAIVEPSDFGPEAYTLKSISLAQRRCPLHPALFAVFVFQTRIEISLRSSSNH